MKSDKINGDGLSLKDFDAQWDRARLAGVDEAGRGPLAGPVVAAAVILDPALDYPGVNDSKKVKAGQREAAFELITTSALAWAWAEVPAGEVDRLNPLGAAMLAMGRALAGLDPSPAIILVDGNQKPRLTPALAALPLHTVVGGDARSLAVAAASIVAKVLRDRLMLAEHEKFPQYGFDRHKGYGTKDHLAALRKHGPCPCHRLSFRGVKPEEFLPGLGFNEAGHENG